MSHTPTLNELLIAEQSTLREAMRMINDNVQGICFVVNHQGQLKGVLTDGDIRRALLEGTSLEEKVMHVMQTSFVSLPVQTDIQKIQSSLNTSIRHIPLLDEQGVVVDYACFSKMHRTPIMQPLLNGNELAYVTDCITSGWISSQGAYVKRFEKEFAAFCGAPFALAVSNGTVALHLALDVLGIGPGDEVLVPDLTFAASINAILYTGATPVIVDVDPVTWTISVEDILRNISPKTKAIMPVHLYGHPCHMDEIVQIASQHQLYIIEDCAEAIGSFYRGKHVGNFGQTATFSFFGNKTITTGEGGMILFQDEKTYEKASVLRDHGMSKQKRYWHEFVGFNYRMTNMQAAIGCAQMERIHDFIASKRKIAQEYNTLLKPLGFQLPPEEVWATCGFWLYTTLLTDHMNVSRDELMQKFLKNGIETRPVFYPLHQMPPYVQYKGKGDLNTSIDVSSRGISLPSSVDITPEEIRNISLAVQRIFQTNSVASS